MEPHWRQGPKGVEEKEGGTAPIARSHERRPRPVGITTTRRHSRHRERTSAAEQRGTKSRKGRKQEKRRDQSRRTGRKKNRPPTYPGRATLVFVDAATTMSASTVAIRIAHIIAIVPAPEEAPRREEEKVRARDLREREVANSGGSKMRSLCGSAMLFCQGGPTQHTSVVLGGRSEAREGQREPRRCGRDM